ncbi:PAS domain-containing sensor histidine kinase [Leptospira fletcheri]|uniref:histidine kinase n=1 Tax=Leptospira fletcheri TaxID=2484981 RepID=A0A4R9G510_9LEPT|nr:PAS domain-containing sensor histidine kinase [Leptospira fletcheri]TGK06514.1 PAS domain-containing sensor histidine kinase [Leptospira fletcheri]
MDRSQDKVYRTIFEQSPIGLIIFNRRGEVVDANVAALRILGMRGEDLIGSSFSDFRDENLVNMLTHAYSGETYEYEGPYFTSLSESSFQIHAKVAPILDEHESVDGLVLTFEDITEKKRTERRLAETLVKRAEIQKALRENERKFRTLFEAAGDAIFIFDGRIFLDCNPRTEEIFGCTKEEMIGHSPVDFSPEFQPDGSNSAEAAIHKIGLAMSGQPQTFEWTHCRKDRTNFSAEVTLNSVRFGDADVIQAIVRDVSERKRSEEQIKRLNEELEIKVSLRTEQLNASNSHLESTIRNLKNALIELKSTQGQLVQSEKMAVLGQLIAGIAHEVNTPLGAIISSNEGIQSVFRDAWETLLKEFSLFNDEEKNFWKMLFFKGSVLPEFYDSAEERKKRKHIRDQLKQEGFVKANSLADNLAELGIEGKDLSEMIASADKERFPVIVANAVHLSGIFRHSNVIREAANKASHVIRALKTYIYQDHSGATEVDVREQLELVLTLYYGKVKQGVEIVRKFHDPSIAFGQADQLTQVWANLINNAFQAISYKGRLELETRPQGGFLDVFITDNGPGIPTEIRERIFEPFFTTKPQGEGSGLGLDICRKILERNNGTIHVESKSGRTTFKVRLPTAPN